MWFVIAWLSCSLSSAPKVVGSALPGVDRPADLEQALRQHLEDPSARFVNRLARSTSPYLRDHATNPVDWYEWGDEALDRAKSTGRLVFLSIGYHTCHWCHVMAHESFEDEGIAEFLNTHFVSIKVDREQRPDVDEVYMDAVHLLGGRGGWPLTAILTPEGEPLFAATYLPARDGDRGSHRGLLSVLEFFVAEWQADPTRLRSSAATITAQMVADARPRPPGNLPSLEVVQRATSVLQLNYDPALGGFGNAPKFPRPVQLDLLLDEAARTGDASVRAPALGTLRQMARRGLHDPIEGGFHRYTVDAEWRVPHFEKMLYDNAQLLTSYARAAALTQDPELRWVTETTATFLIDTLATPEGPFIAALDADSRTPDGHLEEGYYYTFVPGDLGGLPSADLAFALRHFGISAAGQLEGRSVPSLLEAQVPTWSNDDAARVRVALRQLRGQRPAPARDDQVVVAWNGLAISGLVRASRTLGDARWLDAAHKAANALFAEADDPTHRLSRLGVPGGPAAMLEDEANAALAALDLFGATGEARWLAVARARLKVIERHYADPAGGWFRTPDDGAALLRRPKPRFEGAEPSGAASAIAATLRLSHLVGSSPEPADRALRAYASTFDQAVLAMPAVLQQIVRRNADPTEVVLVWPDETDPAPLLEVLARHDLPHAEVITAPVSRLAAIRDVAWLEGKGPRNDAPTAYVCRGGVCQFPVTEPGPFEAALQTLASR